MGRLALWLMMGCGGPQWRNADLQVDVSGLSTSDEDRVRVCVTDAGIHERAIGAGSTSFPGLPAQGPIEVTIDLIDADERVARAGPVTLGQGDDYAHIKWRSCEEDCTICSDSGRGAVAGSDNRLLAIRFLE